MKSFCILEQGRSLRDPLTAMKKELFSTSFSDFYRLNWQRDDDPDAFIHQEDIVWSEGRALLYERVPKDYDYYIFTDDDIEFSSASADIPWTMKALLEEYRPLSGTFLDVQRFTDPGLFNFLGSLDLDACLSRQAFPVAGYDQQVQIFSKSYADVMFPAPYHGAGMSMWYAQWLCSQQYPRKQVCLSEIQIKNTRKEPHENESKEQHTSGVYLVPLFNADLADGGYAWNLAEIQKDNARMFQLEADKDALTYTLHDLAKLYDINNDFFKGRQAVVEDKERYKKALSKKLSILDAIREHASRINREAIRTDRLTKEAALQ